MSEVRQRREGTSCTSDGRFQHLIYLTFGGLLQQVTKQMTQGTPTGLYCPELCCLSSIAWAYHIRCSVTVLVPQQDLRSTTQVVGAWHCARAWTGFHLSPWETAHSASATTFCAHHRQTWPLCSGRWCLFPRKVCNSRPAPSSVGSGAFPGLHCASSLAASR